MGKIIVRLTNGNINFISVENLRHFQGNLKSLDKKGAERCKQSLLKYGFIFPLLVWGNNIIDGHQRLYVVQQMLAGGYGLVNEQGEKIEGLPVVNIPAKNEAEARELVLLKQSQYGRLTNESLYEFIEINKIDFDSITPTLDIPGLNMGTFTQSYYRDVPPTMNAEFESADYGGEKERKNKCPECGHEW
jgi:hypothetical protein